MAKTLRARSAARQARAEARAVRLRALLAPAAEMLRARFCAKHVCLFGSLADGTFSERSDVDLAVTGMPGICYFDALAELMRLFGLPVDLVRTEEAGESLRERISAEGQPL